MSDIQVIVVDDEKPARTKLIRLLEQCDAVNVVAEADNGIEALNLIEKHAPDLVFLDIQMPELSGIGVAREIADKNQSNSPLIVFVTAYDQHALEAFEVNAIDYLLKPYDLERLEKTVHKAQKLVDSNDNANLKQRMFNMLSQYKGEESYEERILVKSGEIYQMLNIADISWIQAEGNYVNLHCITALENGKKSFLVRKTLAKIITELNPKHFARIHRSTIVNLSSIKELHPLFKGDYTVKLKDGSELKLSRNYRQEFFDLLEGWT